MIIVKWTDEKEQEVLAMRNRGNTYTAIASYIGSSASSVKHKVRRLKQSDNDDRYKHTAEKRAQAKPILDGLTRDIDRPLQILETHCGFGGMTPLYNQYGEVLSIDIKGNRAKTVGSMGMEGVTALRADSVLECHRLKANRCRFDVVDVDPYGLPSRYFPHIFSLIEDGVLFLTFPVYGVAQMNKITIAHYDAFWGIDSSGGYVEKIQEGLVRYAFMEGRGIEVVAAEKINRVFRFCISVKKTSMLTLAGLDIGEPCLPSKDQGRLFE